MGRKQVGLKFEEDDLERWDQWAAEHGLTRTAFLEQAAALRISVPVTGWDTPPPTPVTHDARPGVRRAFTCRREGCDRRRFLERDDPTDVPDCPDGHGRMERQANRAYKGQPTS